MTTNSIIICCRKNTRTQRNFLRKTINFHRPTTLIKNYTQELWLIFWKNNLQPSDPTGLNSFSKICLLLDSSSSIKSFWFSTWAELALFSCMSWNKVWSWAELWPCHFPDFGLLGSGFLGTGVSQCLMQLQLFSNSQVNHKSTLGFSTIFLEVHGWQPQGLALIICERLCGEDWFEPHPRHLRKFPFPSH